MRKVLLVFILLVCLVLATGCTERRNENDDPSDFRAIIAYGSGFITVNVECYSRVSSGWIIVTSIDGTKYATNEKNVLLVKKPTE